MFWLILLFFIPFALFYYVYFHSKRVVKQDDFSGLIPSLPLVQQVTSFTETEIQALPFTEALWSIGITKKSATVTEESIVRLLEFFPPSMPMSEEFIEALLIKSMMEPTQILEELNSNDESKEYMKRPRIAAFLDSCDVSTEFIKNVSMRMEKYDIKVFRMGELTAQVPKLLKNRRIELYKKARDAQKTMYESRNKEEPLSSPPQRGCFQCKKEISGKASQCSACKAIIYCSADCAKVSWPQHKTVCGMLKGNIEHIKTWDLHSFPFTFYKLDKPFYNYNQGALLNQHGIHNVGVYKRHCGCASGTPFGELWAETRAQIEAAGVKDPFEIFDSTGLVKEWYPLSEKLPNSRKINSWADLYNAKRVSFDDPAGLVLDYPMTVWFILNKYVLDSVQPGSNEIKNITLHIAGAEVEAEILPLFELLLGLLPPNVHLALHLIGPAISNRLLPEHAQILFKNESSQVLVSLTSSLYTSECHSGSAILVGKEKWIPFGKETPTLVLIMNGYLLADENWIPSFKHLVQIGQRTIITEPMQQHVEAMLRNIPGIGGRVTLDLTPNPFKRPLCEFKRDSNLAGWSNGFIFGIN